MMEINVSNDCKGHEVIVRFDCSGRLCHSLAPLYDKLFRPIDELFFGILRSVAVFLKLYMGLLQCATSKSNRY